MKTRVDALLKVRAIELDMRARDLSETQTAISRTKAKIVAITQGMTRARNELDRAQARGAHSELFGLYDAWFSAQRREIAKLNSHVEDLKQEAIRRQEILQETARELETYERYREQLLDARRQELKSIEGKQLDEFAIRSHFHRQA